MDPGSIMYSVAISLKFKFKFNVVNVNYCFFLAFYALLLTINHPVSEIYLSMVF